MYHNDDILYLRGEKANRLIADHKRNSQFHQIDTSKVSPVIQSNTRCLPLSRKYRQLIRNAPGPQDIVDFEPKPALLACF